MATREPRWGWLLLPLLTFGSGCGGDDMPVEEVACTETELPPEMFTPTVASAPLQGTVRVRDRSDRSRDAMSGVFRNSNRGIVQADFADLRTSTGTPATFLALSENCIGRTSRSGAAPPTFLDMGGLMLSGTGQGAITPMSVGTGRFTYTGEPLFVGAGAMRVTGTAGTSDFPAFDDEVPLVEPIEMTEPVSDGSAVVPVKDLLIRWTGSGGDTAIVTVSPVNTTMIESGGQVICQVVDDACFTLPSSATNFLLSASVDYFTITVERYKVRVLSPGQGTALILESAAEWRATLKNGAFE